MGYSVDDELRVLLAAALLHVVEAEREDAANVARVLLEYAGRFAWLAEVRDPTTELKYAIADCERANAADHGLVELAARMRFDIDRVGAAMEGAEVAQAMRELVDMSCAQVKVKLPERWDQPWLGSAIADCGHEMSMRTTQGLASLLRGLSASVGRHLKGRSKAHLDS